MTVKQCPYCEIKFSLDGAGSCNSFLNFVNHRYRKVSDEIKIKEYTIISNLCPECYGQMIWLFDRTDKNIEGEIILLFPKYQMKNIPPQIPEKYAKDFKEAYSILELSPQASAALSRRCLQNLIRDQENIHKKTLYDEIEELIKLNKVNPSFSKMLNAIRVIGNFAAHPIKSNATGEIIKVEKYEAEHTIKILEDLLLYYFVEKEKDLNYLDNLNKNLIKSGKRPIN